MDLPQLDLLPQIPSKEIGFVNIEAIDLGKAVDI